MGRPRIYASDAERAAAARARNATAEIRLPADMMAWLTDTAAALDVPRTELIYSMLKLARTNRNWARDGITGRPLPRAEAPAGQTWGILKDTAE